MAVSTQACRRRIPTAVPACRSPAQPSRLLFSCGCVAWLITCSFLTGRVHHALAWCNCRYSYAHCSWCCSLATRSASAPLPSLFGFVFFQQIDRMTHARSPPVRLPIQQCCAPCARCLRLATVRGAALQHVHSTTPPIMKEIRCQELVESSWSAQRGGSMLALRVAQHSVGGGARAAQPESGIQAAGLLTTSRLSAISRGSLTAICKRSRAPGPGGALSLPAGALPPLSQRCGRCRSVFSSCRERSARWSQRRRHGPVFAACPPCAPPVR